MKRRTSRRNSKLTAGSLRKFIEAVESRIFLSGTVGASGTPTDVPLLLPSPPIVQFPVGNSGGSNGTPDTGYTSPNGLGYSAAQIRGAYGLGQWNASNIKFNGVQGDGTGQTIAIIDAYNDPTIAADLVSFDSMEGLPNPPSFTVVNQTGGTALPANDVQGSDSSWAPEESLDVEWSHVMAPGASIIVFECNNLEIGDQTAAATPGVSVVSNSWGSNESSNEASSQDPYFTTPSGHAGVTFFASTGDSGGAISYPAESPNVVAVGGTDLNVSGDNWSSESAWSDGGGGTSAYEPQPSYQAGTITATNREDPDISLDADPSTGVPIYDSWDYGTGTGWEGVYGGTSLSSPMAAGLVAVADQGRAAEGLTSLNSKQTLTRLYQLSKANFHDIISGNNGHQAAVGYDEATGIGTPIANLMVPDLAGAATITGRAFVDNSGNGIYGGTDTPIAGLTVYLDLNGDGTQDNSEPSTTTNAQGIYTFTDEPAGGVIRMSSSTPAGYTMSSASTASIVYGATETVNFTYQSQAASKLVFAQQPATATQGATMNPVVVDVDTAAGTVASTNSSTVTLTLSTGTFSTGLNTATATAVAGVATFNSLVINTSGTYTLTATDGSLTSAISNSFNIIKVTPTVTWVAPASISYGTALSSTQLDATASVPGTFSYTPAAGTVLKAGQNQTLSVLFTPTDTADYQTATATTTITVTSAAITLTGSDLYLKRQSSTSDNLEVWNSTTDTGSPAEVLSFSSITVLTLTAGATADSFTADFSNGSVAPEQDLVVKGIGSAANNSLTIVGTGGSDSIFVSGSTIGLNNLFIQTTKIGNLYFQSPGAGEALNLSSGALTILPNTSGAIALEAFASVSIGAGTELLVPAASTPATRILLQTGALNIGISDGQWTGTLDLANNDLDVANGNLATITSQVAQGFTSQSVGIISSAAQSDTTLLTTLGVIQNSVDGTPAGAPLYGNGTALGTFDGTSPASTDVLVKYTYYGDANLTGNVDGSDYARIDNAVLTGATGWFNGDFNDDGVIDGSDYTLIDNSDNMQGASLSAQIAPPAKAAARAATMPASIFSQLQVSTSAADSTGSWISQSNNVAAGIFASDDDSLLRLKGNKLVV